MADFNDIPDKIIGDSPQTLIAANNLPDRDIGATN